MAVYSDSVIVEYGVKFLGRTFNLKPPLILVHIYIRKAEMFPLCNFWSYLNETRYIQKKNNSTVYNLVSHTVWRIVISSSVV